VDHLNTQRGFADFEEVESLDAAAYNEDNADLEALVESDNLIHAVELLPTRQRLCVSLLLEGHSMTDVATQMGIARQNAHKLYGQAVLNLRKQLLG